MIDILTKRNADITTADFLRDLKQKQDKKQNKITLDQSFFIRLDKSDPNKDNESVPTLEIPPSQTPKLLIYDSKSQP